MAQTGPRGMALIPRESTAWPVTTSRTGPGPAKTRPDNASAKAPAERPFDMWLQKQLHAMYDEIAGEPLPDDLLGLIDSDAAETGKERRASRGKK